jgi:hypothetical protein
MEEKEKLANIKKENILKLKNLNAKLIVRNSYIKMIILTAN